ncbi:MAG TPA: hypothetical protein VMA72_26430 [Streptosporangiaceae bacterium]|nr:hypothetical protein [Streptosporangiaceae bacterium]
MRRRFRNLALTYLGACIGFAVWAVSTHAQAALSSHLHYDGLHRTGGIVRVENLKHQDTRSGPWYSALVTVTLAPPLDGHSTTLVHDPHGSSLVAGEGLEILVDPQQPGYAELPACRSFITGSGSSPAVSAWRSPWSACCRW